MRETIPDLTFPMVQFGEKEHPWDLASLLYPGAAGLDMRKWHARCKPNLGKPRLSRLALVIKLHDAILAGLVSGMSRHTAKRHVVQLRRFYAWMDRNGLDPTIETVEDYFLGWADELYQVASHEKIRIPTARLAASCVSTLLDAALDRRIGIIRKSRFGHTPTNRRKPIKADKQNLEHALAFGRALSDLNDVLDAATIFGPLPVVIRFSDGTIIEEWCTLLPKDALKTLKKRRPREWEKMLEVRAAWEADKTWRTRYPLINLRIESELLVFIAQTGMNLAQAYQLAAGRFSFQSSHDGHVIGRVYKVRRQGEVAFSIYSAYRPMFERYLAWRSEVFPDDPDGRLFPQRGHVQRSDDVAPTFRAVRKICGKLGVRFCGARELRKTRVNWLLRRTMDPSTTAEMAQHSELTLLRDYAQPHHQTALAEISTFLQAHEESMLAAGPGVCAGDRPMPLSDVNPSVPTPDCVSPAGCLFCVYQRDIASLDHIWSLATYRYYKTLELALTRSPPDRGAPHPAYLVIERLTQKLHTLSKSSKDAASWVSEAEARIKEAAFHPRWDGFVQLAEARG